MTVVCLHVRKILRAQPKMVQADAIHQKFQMQFKLHDHKSLSNRDLHLVKYHLIIVIKFKKQKAVSIYRSAFSIIEKICERLRSKVDQFVENDSEKIHEILLKYQQNIDRTKTIGQLKQFLHYTPRIFKLGARINVQRTPISQRNTGIK